MPLSVLKRTMASGSVLSFFHATTCQMGRGEGAHHREHVSVGGVGEGWGSGQRVAGSRQRTCLSMWQRMWRESRCSGFSCDVTPSSSPLRQRVRWGVGVEVSGWVATNTGERGDEAHARGWVGSGADGSGGSDGGAESGEAG